ncbi:MAG: NlpC/P60 family protein, partial [Bacteroidota bacterium]|nr:NlpC/P60 family protein [Bacteroidota bacterium]
MKLLPPRYRFLALLPLLLMILQACASLEPLPRFRTSSTSFAPDQLPLAERSSKDLIDPATVASYSSIKEEAEQSTTTESEKQVQRLIINQAIASQTMYVDEPGLDIEEIEDELAEGDDLEEEDVAVSAVALQKVIQQSTVLDPEKSPEINAAVNRPEMMREIVNLLGLRYRYGGTDATAGLDCSAFTGTIYSRALGVRLPRSSNQQFREGSVIKRDELRIGDLVFFKTRRRRAPVSHVGIYIGGNLFAHASTKYGVIISSLDHPYYNRTFVSARRLLLDAP